MTMASILEDLLPTPEQIDLLKKKVRDQDEQDRRINELFERLMKIKNDGVATRITTPFHVTPIRHIAPGTNKTGYEYGYGTTVHGISPKRGA
jgi:hypothetical protein